MNELIINIKENFYPMPMGRYHPKDGDYTGELFRKTWLEPNFDKYDKLIIELDDLVGCPSSFREEAFGGLARIFGIKEVLKKLEFRTIDFSHLLPIIRQDILDANKNIKR
jgi:hypothetical protein